MRPSESRQVRREALGVQAGQATRSKSYRTLDEWIESLSERERDFIPRSRWFAGLNKAQQTHVLRRVEAFEEVEEAAEFEFQQWKERQSLRNIDALAESEEWAHEREEEGVFGEELAARMWPSENAQWGVSDEAVAAAAQDLYGEDADFDNEGDAFEDGEAA